MKVLTVKEISLLWHLEEKKITRLCRDNRILGAYKENNTWYIPSDATKPVDGRTKAASLSNQEIQVNAKNIEFTSQGIIGRVENLFLKKYGKKCEYTAYTPYRISPLGAHVDHNLGKITGFTIDKGIAMAYGKKLNGVIEIASLQFPKRGQWHVNATPEGKENDWADPLRGATISLNKRYQLKVGLCAIIDGELPIGGLSSSSSLTLTFIKGLCKLNNIHLDEAEYLEIALESEREYLKNKSGELDEIVELYAKKDCLLYEDLRLKERRLIPNAFDKKYMFCLFFSGLYQSKLANNYNLYVDELKSVAFSINNFNGKYETFENSYLGMISYDDYLKYHDKFSLTVQKHANHFFKENQRVEAGIKYFALGDAINFGRLMNESGKSTIDNWESGSEEMIDLENILISTEGVLGARYAGSGFKGCCIALIDTTFKDSIFKEVEEKYLNKYPNMKNKYSAHLVSSADTIKL